MVHTRNGPMPIERIEIGDLVMSLPETGENPAYARVLNTVVHHDKEVILVSFIVNDEPESSHLVVTGDHPFWVKGKGWLRADRMSGGEFIQIQDGREAYVYLAYALFKTNREGSGWTCHPGFEEGTEVDLRNDGIEVVSERSLNGEDSGVWGFVHQNVYNLEVESPDGFCVGDAAVRVQGEHPPTIARQRGQILRLKLKGKI